MLAFRTALNPVASSGGLPVSGASLWLDASVQSSLFKDAGVTNVSAQGDLVYQWNDLSGNNRNAIQATSGNRPAWNTPANGKNSLSTVGFNGTAAYLRNSAVSVSFTSATIFLLFQMNSGSNSYARLYTHSAGGTDYNEAGNWLPFYRNIGTTFASATTANGPVASLTGSYNWQLARHVHSGTTIQNTINGTTQSSVSSVATLNKTITLMQIGKTINSAAEWFSGSAGEIIVYNRQLSSTEISTVENYLKTKWGTP